jgi:hypothetical protein
MHALEAVNFALGDFDGVTAELVRGRKEVHLTDTDTTFPVTTADQVSVTGTLRGGAAVSFFYRGGISRGAEWCGSHLLDFKDLLFAQALINLRLGEKPDE